MRAGVAVFLLSVLALPGCTSLREQVSELRAGDVTPPPYYTEHRDTLGADYNKSIPVDVGPRARHLNVTILLESALSQDGLAPARVHVGLLDPEGSLLREATLGPGSVQASLLLDEFPSTGLYTVEIRGMSASGLLGASDARVTYRLSIELLHG